MTVKISPHKTSKILRYFFKGMPQPEIADKCRINQATVSRYALKFKADANEMGIMVAAKEYGIMDEVDSLRSLAVELLNNKLTAEEAKEGVTIQKYFNSFGIAPSQYKTLVKVISELKNPDFAQSAIKLAELENATGKKYTEIVSQYEDLLAAVPELEQKNANLTKERKMLEQTIKQLTAERKKKQQSLLKLENESKRKQSSIKAGLDKKIRETNLTFGRINRLEPIADKLEKMGITDEKLENFLIEYQELDELGVTPENLKTMIEGTKK